MRDLRDTIGPLSIFASIAFILYGFGQVIFLDMKNTQERFEQCIAAEKQWVSGSCVTGQWFLREMKGADLKREQP